MTDTNKERAAADNLADDLIRGGKAIAAFYGFEEKQTYYMLERGRLPGCFKLGSVWFGRRSAMLKGIEQLAEGGAA